MGSESDPVYPEGGAEDIADSIRINERIRADVVRLIGPDGEQVGVVNLREALAYADRLNLDLVEVAPQASPPVCKVMDYGKYRYEQEQKAKEARKRQTTISIKEIKLRPKIDDHDFEVKKGHVERFLKKGDKVKLTIMFRGRELVHPHLGERLLRRMAEDLAELGDVESQPNLDGRNMVMMLAPKKQR
ncbi:MAG: translation initiation factor IF-3 [Actinobacteria bacterium]|nr:translation initiation factor IF-3 [Actinomycetota bacterium]